MNRIATSSLYFGKKPEKVGHRGGRTSLNPTEIPPENTIPAFKLAKKQGAEACELDVIALRDEQLEDGTIKEGPLVVTHDDRLGRIHHLGSLNDSQPLVKELTSSELQWTWLNVEGHETTVNKTLGTKDYKMDSQFDNTPIPTLESVLEEFPDTHFYVELKTISDFSLRNNGLEKKIVKLIQEKNLYDQVTVISFNLPSLLRVKRLDPNIKAGLDIKLGNPSKKRLLPLLLVIMKMAGIETLLPEYKSVDQALVDNVHQKQMKIAPWVYHETRKEEEVLFPELVKMGVDSIVTNAVDSLNTFLNKKNP